MDDKELDRLKRAEFSLVLNSQISNADPRYPDKALVVFIRPFEKTMYFKVQVHGDCKKGSELQQTFSTVEKALEVYNKY